MRLGRTLGQISPCDCNTHTLISRKICTEVWHNKTHHKQFTCTFVTMTMVTKLQERATNIYCLQNHKRCIQKTDQCHTWKSEEMAFKVLHCLQCHIFESSHTILKNHAGKHGQLFWLSIESKRNYEFYCHFEWGNNEHDDPGGAQQSSKLSTLSVLQFCSL